MGAGVLGPSPRPGGVAALRARGPFTELHGPEAIAVLPGRRASPTPRRSCSPRSRRPAATPQTLAAAAQRDTAALERGIKMRTLYQHSARRSSITHKYVAAVTARGAEVRTLDEFFNRMIVIDRRIAVDPRRRRASASALAIREPSLVAYLVDIFERTWERGRPFTNRETSMMRDIAAEQRAMTIRMLIEGHADPVSAKRLGVSPRTYAGYVADLKAEYEAETRFQLGYAMGQPGVSGNEQRTDERRRPRAADRRTGRTKYHEGSDRAVTALVQLRRAGGWRWDRTRGGWSGPRLKPVGLSAVQARSAVGDVSAAAGSPSWCPWPARAPSSDQTDAHSHDGGHDRCRPWQMMLHASLHLLFVITSPGLTR